MDWNATLDTANVVGPAEEARRALGAMGDAATAAGAALQGSANAAGAAASSASAAAQQQAGAAAGASNAAAAGAANASGKANKGLSDVANGAKNAGNAASKGLGKALDAGGASAGKVAGMLRGAVLPAVAAIGAAAGAATILDLAKIAIGARAVSQLQAISGRTQAGFRRLFSGVDAGPLTRAAERFSRNLTAQTVTGRAVGDILTRGFNSAFGALEKLEPIGTAAFQGLVLGSLLVEQAILRARIALFPYIGDVTGLVDAGTAAKVVGYGIAAAMGVVAVSLALAAAPFVAAAAGAMVLYNAGQRVYGFFQEFAASPLYTAIGNAVTGAFDAAGAAVDAVLGKIKSVVGAVTDAVTSLPIIGDIIGATKGAAGAVGSIAGQAADAVGGAVKAADKAVGDAVGTFVQNGGSLGDGVVSGLDAKEGAIYQAGVRAAKAAVRGAKDGGEIKSPSRKMRREVGRQLGEGVALGEEDMAGRVQSAAASALVPDVSFGGRSAKGGGVTVTGPLLHVGQIVVNGAEDLAAEVRRVLATETALAAEKLGIVLVRT